MELRICVRPGRELAPRYIIWPYRFQHLVFWKKSASFRSCLFCLGSPTSHGFVLFPLRVMIRICECWTVV